MNRTLRENVEPWAIPRGWLSFVDRVPVIVGIGMAAESNWRYALLAFVGLGEAPVTAEPRRDGSDDDGQRHLRPHGDCEHAIEMLKAAFVAGSAEQ